MIGKLNFQGKKLATATYEKTSVCLGLRQRVTLSRDRETELSCALSLVQRPSNLRDDKSRCRLAAVGIVIGRSDHLVLGLRALASLSREHSLRESGIREKTA